MPLTRVVADALGVVTICLVALLIVLGLFCTVYSFFFRHRIRDQHLPQLSYFSGPWIIRITLIFLSVWWGLGEIVRLKLFRHNGRLLNTLSSSWQENICKCYIVSSLGIAEPCLFLTLIFLLRASLQRSGTLSRQWNAKTAGYVTLYCLPIFILQLVVILIGPTYKNHKDSNLPSYFIETAHHTNNEVILCTYPLLSTIFLGLFATILTAYLFCLGRRILHLVINKGLQRRVYALIFSISSFFPLRVILLGLSVLFKPEKLAFDAIAFIAFLSLLCCAGVGICMLVYLPVADSSSFWGRQRDVDARRRRRRRNEDTISLIANQTFHGESTVSSNLALDSSTGSSICFRSRDEMDATGTGFVELSLFTSTPPDSPTRVSQGFIGPDLTRGVY